MESHVIEERVTKLVSLFVSSMKRANVRAYPVEVGDIAIIRKGMPHGWHEITSDTISYIIFRGDPNEVMQIKNSAD